MSTQTAIEAPRRRSARAAVCASIGPLTIAGGVVWAVAQPERITLLHPHGQGFWWLFAEAPLYVVLAGVVFALVVAPGLLEDLEEER